MKLDRNLVQVQRAANALSLSSHLMPEDRRRELEEKVKNYYEVEEITTEILSRAKNLEIHIANAEYRSKIRLYIFIACSFFKLNCNFTGIFLMDYVLLIIFKSNIKEDCFPLRSDGESIFCTL